MKNDIKDKKKTLKFYGTFELTIVVMGVFIAALLIGIYLSQEDNKQEILNGHKSYTNELAWSVAYFFENRKNDLKESAYSCSISGKMKEGEATNSITS